METTTIHPAEAYLRNEQNPTSLYVRIAGKRRRLFINRNENVIGIIALGKRKSGYIFTTRPSSIHSFRFLSFLPFSTSLL